MAVHLLRERSGYFFQFLIENTRDAHDRLYPDKTAPDRADEDLYHCQQRFLALLRDLEDKYGVVVTHCYNSELVGAYFNDRIGREHRVNVDLDRHRNCAIPYTGAVQGVISQDSLRERPQLLGRIKDEMMEVAASIARKHRTCKLLITFDNSQTVVWDNEER